MNSSSKNAAGKSSIVERPASPHQLPGAVVSMRSMRIARRNALAAPIVTAPSTAPLTTTDGEAAARSRPTVFHGSLSTFLSMTHVATTALTSVVHWYRMFPGIDSTAQAERARQRLEHDEDDDAYREERDYPPHYSEKEPGSGRK